MNLINRQLRQLRQVLRSSFCKYSTSVSTQSTQVVEALDGWAAKLRESGVGDIEFNLKCIVAHVLKKKFNALPKYENLKFTPEQYAEFQRLCEARCGRMPLQYIVGEWDFMDITLKTAPSVFIPRPETEEFVSKVISELRDEPIVNMLEVGCGSGAMSLAILNALPQVRAVGIECSKLATTLASENAKSLGLNNRFNVYNHTVVEKEYMPKELADRRFDIIISNPPYVKTDEFQHLQPEVVAYENIKALDGGPDGLRIARLVFDLACTSALRTGGKLWMELGSEHPPLVKTIINLKYEGRLRYISGHKDQYGHDRFVEIEKV